MNQWRPYADVASAQNCYARQFMLSPLKILGAVAVTVIAATLSAMPSASEPRSNVRVARAGCARIPEDDSLDFLAEIQGVVADSQMHLRSFTGLPYLHKDSVTWSGTALQCDTAAARYRRYKGAQLGDSTWPLIPVVLLRVGSTHWAADAHIGDQTGMREWAVFDSALNVVKLYKTVP